MWEETGYSAGKIRSKKTKKVLDKWGLLGYNDTRR